MLIKKEDKHSITCRVSKEELSARGFDNIEDLLHDQAQARKLLDEVIEEARETVDFPDDNSQINVQMVGLADGSVTIRIFSDRKAAVKSIIEKYKDIAQMVEQQEEKQAEEKQTEEKPEKKDPNVGVEIDTIAPRFSGRQNITLLTEDQVKERLAATDSDSPVLFPVALSFDNLEDAISLCHHISAEDRSAASNLYRMDDRYYLTIELTDTKKTLANTVFAISEYSGRIENHGNILGLLREHGDVIRENDAVGVLASL